MLNEQNKMDMEKQQPPINYWKEIQKELPETLHDLNGIVLLVHNSIEFVDIVDFINKIRPDHFLNVLYISLTRSYNYITKALELKPFDSKKLFVIDCVSGFAFPPEDHIDESLYHSPPQNLLELKKMIELGVEKANPDIIILDSLSQFINFSQPSDEDIFILYRFLGMIRENMLNIVQSTFLILYDSKMMQTKHLPKIGTDTIIKLEKEKPRPYDDKIGSFYTVL